MSDNLLITAVAVLICINALAITKCNYEQDKLRFDCKKIEALKSGGKGE